MDNLINLTPLFEAVIKLLFALLVIKVLPLIREKLDDEQEARLANYVQIAVYAAEKMYGAGNGAQKMEYAQFLIRKRFGVELEMNTLVAMINAEIKKMELQEAEITVEPEIVLEQGVVDPGCGPDPTGDLGTPGEPGTPEA